MIAAELRDRVVPWVHVFDRRTGTRTKRRGRPWTLKQTNAALTWLALVVVVYALRAGRPVLLLAAGICTALVLRNNLPRYRFFVRHRGHAFALAAVPLELMSHLLGGLALVSDWLMRQLVGEPKPHPTVEAFAEIGVPTWPPVPAQRVQPVERVDPVPQSPETLSRPA
jgi:hypothetical protein